MIKRFVMKDLFYSLKVLGFGRIQVSSEGHLKEKSLGRGSSNCKISFIRLWPDY
jgi:hypothetical protein